jgi:hypothetical protein
MLRATLNEAFPIQVLAADGRTGLFGRATIYRNGSSIAMVTLPHIAQGMYGSTYVPTQEGFLSIIYQLYLDSGFTQPADYDLESEGVEVSSDKTNVLRILGLLHENTVFDQQVYDMNSNLSSGRLRVYDSKTNAISSGLTGLLFTYTVLASYSGGQLTRYLITRES